MRLFQAVFSVFLWPSFGCVSYNPLFTLSLTRSGFLSGGLSDIFSTCLYINCVPKPSFLPDTFLLCDEQVIYKKFNVPCPFTDFSFNATSTTSWMNVTDPGGEEDPACIPKMANLNSQVGSCMSLTLQMHLHCHGHWQPPTYFTVIFSMLPVPLHSLSMEILVWSTQLHWARDQDIYQAFNTRHNPD